MKKKLTKNEKRDIKDLKKILDTYEITPELLEEAEKMHKRLSYVSWEDMNRPFTI